MAGMDIVLRDKKGKIKQDYHVERTPEKGKIVEVDKLKKKELKEEKKHAKSWRKNQGNHE